MFEKNFRIHEAFRNVDFDYEIVLPKHEPAAGTKVFGELHLQISAKAKGKGAKKIGFSEEYVLPIELKYGLCDSCSIKKTEYYEAIVQLRVEAKTPESETAFKEILAYVRKYEKEHNKKGVFITKEMKTANGIDFYLTSNSYAVNLARKTGSRFGAEVKVNERIFSRSKSGKDIYRVTALIRVPQFTRDSIISLKQKGASEHKIVRVVHAGKNLIGENLENGKRVTLKMSEISEISVLEKKDAQIIKTFPKIEVLHPETFQAVDIQNIQNPRIRQQYLEAAQKKGRKELSAQIVLFQNKVYLV